jgi:hypothetical protein
MSWELSVTKVLYIIGSLRNPGIPVMARAIREACPDVEVFDDWFAAGPTADDAWKEYEQARGRSYKDALEGYAAKHVFDFDKFHLNRATHVLLVLPAGKSGHMEAMYGLYGAGKKTAILLDPEDVRWDVMYKFIPTILDSTEGVRNWLEEEYAEGFAVPEERTEAVRGFPPRGRGLTVRVPASRGLVGLLPECIGGGVSAVVSGDPAAPSRRTYALGSRQVD